jgi:hypothetical protein
MNADMLNRGTEHRPPLSLSLSFFFMGGELSLSLSVSLSLSLFYFFLKIFFFFLGNNKCTINCELINFMALAR